MNWYRLAKSYELREPTRIPSNPAQSWLDFQEDGYYWGYVLELVPIDKIKFEVWSKQRLDSALEGLKDGKALPAVNLVYVEDRGVYEVSDGNHRVAASKEVGYDEVPAVVGKKIYEAPEKPPEDDIMLELMSKEGLAQLSVLKDFGYSSLENFDIVYEDTFSDGYKMLISHSGEWEEEPLFIKIDNGGRIARMNFNGESFESSGTIDNVINDLKSFLSRVF